MIFRSPFPDIEIPAIPLHELVLRRAGDNADRPAFIDGASGQTLSHGELAASVRAAAAGLSQRGFGKGDVMAISSPNIPAYAIAYFAVSSLGGMVTTINPLSTPREIAGQLADSGARMAVTIAPLLPSLREAMSAIDPDRRGTLGDVFVFGETEEAVPFSSVVQEGLAALGSGNDISDPGIDPRADIVALPYSSGTTGLPKGVMLTHHNVVSNVSQMLSVEPIDESEVGIGVLPFFHIYGMVCVMCTMIASGASVVTMARFDLEAFLAAIAKYRVTRAHLVPPIMLALAKHPIVDNYDLSSLRSITVGAAPVSVQVSEACERRLGCAVREGYGLTEASPVTHFTPLPEDLHRPGSAGPALPNTEVIIADLDSGAPLGAGEDGEVWVRGPQVMTGYLNQPGATELTVDSEGWLHTGDIGHADADGWLYLVDRAKELIKYKGFQVAPAELESLLISHPDVIDAAVIPKADAEAGEVPKGFVVLAGDVAATEATADELMRFVASEVAPYKKLREIAFVDEIPKSPSGKILRRVLRDRENAGRQDAC